MGQSRDIPVVESRNCAPVPGRSQRDRCNLQLRLNRRQTDLILFPFHKDAERQTAAGAETSSVFTFSLAAVRRIISPPQRNKLRSSHDAGVYTSCTKTAGRSHLKIRLSNGPCKPHEKMHFGAVCFFQQNQNKNARKTKPKYQL